MYFGSLSLYNTSETVTFNTDLFDFSKSDRLKETNFSRRAKELKRYP